MATYTRGSSGTILDLGVTGLGDITTDYQDITFKFVDSNSNYTPQNRIRSRVSVYGVDAGNQSLEGSGQLEFYSSFGTSDTTANENLVLLLGANGNCAIGGNNSATSDPGYALKVNGTMYSSGSSRDYKENIEEYTPDTSKLFELRPVQYDYKPEHEDKGYVLGSEKQVGFIAEEIAEVYPELAIKNFEGDPETGANADWVVRNVDYAKLSIILLEEVKKLRTEVDALKAQ